MENSSREVPGIIYYPTSLYNSFFYFTNLNFTRGPQNRIINKGKKIVLDESAIIRKCKAGDQNAFETLVDAHADRAFRVAFRILNDEMEAEDVVQEAFIRAWEKMGDFRENASFSAWIHKIAANLSLDILRSGRKRRTQGLGDGAIEQMLSSLADPERELDRRETAMLISALADRLSPKQKLAFVLVDVEGLSHDEAMKISGMSNTQLKSNLYHARKITGERINKLWK